jgi:hypothetical protein
MKLSRVCGGRLKMAFGGLESTVTTSLLSTKRAIVVEEDGAFAAKISRVGGKWTDVSFFFAA